MTVAHPTVVGIVQVGRSVQESEIVQVVESVRAWKSVQVGEIVQVVESV